VVQIGFSISTSTPLSRKASATAKCEVVGTATVTASTLPIRSARSVNGRAPVFSALASARLASMSQTPTSSAASSAAYFWACKLPK
jgi:hypothetical protein